ncbi:hypothetical protein [Paenibacillus tundrae]|uniref:Uncharacterized protein n=1 Tax=Paenibacillus tundrae TaxID=528187 RepID=A0ABT9WBA3_9BACL|nr:hypothetical protein [Paenibacillus tundrae]MDQ0170545.1 hypothetical protein [Paenibacillus tundrae]
MTNDVLTIFKEINNKDNLPAVWLRRNSTHYHLVSYINHIIGLYLSGTFEFIPVFINRADKELNSLTDRIGHHRYFEKCRILLLQVSDEITTNLHNSSHKEILPLIYQEDKERFSTCPEKFCFHWVEEGTIKLPFQFAELEEAFKLSSNATPSKTSYCGCVFGTCKRQVVEDGNKDWYEPNEPLLSAYKVSDNHFRNDC